MGKGDVKMFCKIIKALKKAISERIALIIGIIIYVIISIQISKIAIDNLINAFTNL